MSLRNIFERGGGQSNYDGQIDSRLLVEQRERAYRHELRVAASDLHMYEHEAPAFPEIRHDIVAGEAAEDFLLSLGPQTIEAQFLHLYEARRQISLQSKNDPSQEPYVWCVEDFADEDHRVGLFTLGHRIGELVFDRGMGSYRELTLKINTRNQKELDAAVDACTTNALYSDEQVLDAVVRYGQSHAEKIYDIQTGAALLRYALHAGVAQDDLRRYIDQQDN